jgi:O-Antigen ligase
MARALARLHEPREEDVSEYHAVVWRVHRVGKAWAYVVALLIIGYLSMSRSFAYIGIPALKFFIGEATLGAVLLMNPKAVLGRWVAALVKPIPLSGVAWGVLLLLVYGLFQLLRGFALGYRPMTILQNLAFNYYPLYFFLGFWVGSHQPGVLPWIMRALAWGNGLYGVAYLLFLNRLTVIIPGSPDVPVFGQPIGSAAALLGLMAFESSLTKVWPLLLLNSFVMLGIQVRAEWLGFLVGTLLWGRLTGRLGRLAVGGMAIVVLLCVMYLADVNLPASRGRGGSISVQEMTGRILAPLNQELAAQYSEHTGSYAGTISWRTDWWRAIWDSVHQDQVRTIFGHGYGVPLGDLVPYLAGDVIRTPHNVFFYALAYGGWLGVAIFFTLQLTLAQLLLKAHQLTGRPFGLAYWAMALMVGFFSNFFETPLGAIPFYLLLGLSIAHASHELMSGYMVPPRRYRACRACAEPRKEVRRGRIRRT